MSLGAGTLGGMPLLFGYPGAGSSPFVVGQTAATVTMRISSIGVNTVATGTATTVGNTVLTTSVVTGSVFATRWADKLLDFRLKDRAVDAGQHLESAMRASESALATLKAALKASADCKCE